MTELWRTMVSRTHAERLAALLILLFSLAYFWLAFSIKVPPSSDDSPFSARSFPLMLGPLGASSRLSCSSGRRPETRSASGSPGAGGSGSSC